MRYDKCSECDSTMSRMYSKEYLDEHYPVNSPRDRDNINLQVESKRLFECKKCGHKHRLTNAQYVKYILESKRGKI